MGHLTARDNYQWTTHQTSSDSYTNNRHNQVGQLYQFDADGRMTSGEYVAYEYDAAGRASTVWSSSTATLGLDGDGQQVKSAETVYDPGTQTDITTTKYYVRSSVLGGEVLTELESDGYYSRAFVYAGGAVLATQERWGGSEQVSWEHRDPSNASYRTSAVGNPAGVQAELDPVGANKGVSDPAYTQTIPDEGALAPYASFNNPAQPTMTYSIDGVRVPLDHFMVMFNLNFKSNLYLAEQVAGASTPTLTSYSVSRFHGRLIRDFGLNLDRAHDEALEQSNLTRNWLADSNWDFDSSLLPQKTAEFLPVDLDNIRRGLAWYLVNPDCAGFINDLLNRVATGDNPRARKEGRDADILDIFDVVRGGITRESNPGGGQALGSIEAGDASIKLSPTLFGGNPSAGEKATSVLETDIRIVLHEIIHLSGRRRYHDNELAVAVAAMTGTQRPGPTGRGPLSDAFQDSTFWDNELRKHCKDFKVKL